MTGPELAASFSTVIGQGYVLGLAFAVLILLLARRGGD